MSTPATVTLTPQELIEQCALDSGLYCTQFFPRTFRQESPAFHKDAWDLLEDRAHRYTALAVFRGGAKTTTLRVYTTKRIAYGTSRTILFVSESQGSAEKSVRWIKGQVERNTLWAGVFGLSRGSKWTDDEIEVAHKALGITITVKALGITGQIRGINIEDYRPDLIVVDDPCDEENTATPEQRKKTSDLFFGALARSLTPRSECPDAKMALLQTPLNREDLISQCISDPQWAVRVYSCFDDQGESRWPSRHPTQELLAEKEAYVRRNQLSLWLREMECAVVSSETVYFHGEWLKYFDITTLPEELLKSMTVYLGLDPVPPPSDREIAVGFKGKDYEVQVAIGAIGKDRYLLDLHRSTGHDPSWSITTFFSLVDRWRPIKARVESTGYQRTLKWHLEQEMSKRGKWVQINGAADKRHKSVRIRQAFSDVASAGHLHVQQYHSSFINQFVAYPDVVHDDDLDAVAMALDEARGLYVVQDELGLDPEGAEVEALVGWRSAP
ncbi:MAG TPA: hypothetical protein VLH56_19120 [Dissulfurispiraceae bacterium]|nr:hypothetical protein [Dissulfurispiraceae bacterium]